MDIAEFSKSLSDLIQERDYYKDKCQRLEAFMILALLKNGGSLEFASKNSLHESFSFGLVDIAFGDKIQLIWKDTQHFLRSSPAHSPLNKNEVEYLQGW